MSFTFSFFAKFHNQYGEVDQLMRQFAKACTQLPDHASHIAQKLEYALNTNVVIRDPQKVTSLDLPTPTKQEYHTVDPGVLA